MCNPADGLGFQEWYEYVFGAVREDRREMYELWRWAWKYLERVGEERTYRTLVHTIRHTDVEWRIRDMQILNECYALYEEDHRRHSSTLAPGVRLGSLLAFGARPGSSAVGVLSKT